ncbi:MAG TPA: SRPBCC family protein [Gemmatimonadaceae bacterium]|nr:SRPBCC family protein [Gemmatimonadaceae bacterium]
MSLQIRESFQLNAPADRVWDYLTDPRCVVTCLPGAELVSVESADTYVGRVKVKVGPVTAAYDGKVTMLERDETRRVVRMRGEGREAGGSGSATMTMTSTVVALTRNTTRVEVAADIDIVGRIMQFGRGMIESVNKQLFKQFTACLIGVLEQPVTVESPAPVPTAEMEAAARPVPLLTLVFRAIRQKIRALLRA